MMVDSTKETTKVETLITNTPKAELQLFKTPLFSSVDYPTTPLSKALVSTSSQSDKYHQPELSLTEKLERYILFYIASRIWIR
jgi:hypothetical protein